MQEVRLFGGSRLGGEGAVVSSKWDGCLMSGWLLIPSEIVWLVMIAGSYHLDESFEVGGPPRLMSRNSE